MKKIIKNKMKSIEELADENFDDEIYHEIEEIQDIKFMIYSFLIFLIILFSVFLLCEITMLTI